MHFPPYGGKRVFLPEEEKAGPLSPKGGKGYRRGEKGGKVRGKGKGRGKWKGETFTLRSGTSNLLKGKLFSLMREHKRGRGHCKGGKGESTVLMYGVGEVMICSLLLIKEVYGVTQKGGGG